VKNRIWRPLAALVVMATVWFCATAQEYAGTVYRYVLFNGTALDSTEHATPWFPVRDAHRIMIRTWSTHAAETGGGAGDPDSTTTDSIATWKTDFSDSASLYVRDSAGTIVTFSNLIPKTSVHSEPFPWCADSIEFSGVTYNDSIFAMTQGRNFPVNVQLRAPVSGSGRLSSVFNNVPGSMSVCGDCTLDKKYMRFKITPVRRMTSGTAAAQGPGFGNRVNGLKGLRMEAYVYIRHH
jgi:hypothetical protein